MNILRTGKVGSPVVVVCDWVSTTSLARGEVMIDTHRNFVLRKLKTAGVDFSDCVFINPCPTQPMRSGKPPTEKQHTEWVAGYREEFMEKFLPVANVCKVVLVMGKSAGKQVFGRSVKVTKMRGTFHEAKDIKPPILVTLSPAHVLSRPELEVDSDTDFRTLGTLGRSGWVKKESKQGKYEVVTDISDWLENPPPFLCLDTETTGLKWANGDSIICIQMTVEEGFSRIIPVNRSMFPEYTRAQISQALAQVRELLANPKVKVFGHNLKFDLHMLDTLRIKVANWWMDTLQLLFAFDENMQSKSLDEGVRRIVPEMAGYADEFNSETDKGKMLEVPQDKLIQYAGGDTDACFRLCCNLVAELKKDKKQWATVVKIQMPALRMFYRMEKQGMRVNTKRLRALAVTMESKAFELESTLTSMVPKKVKQKHFDLGLSFGRKQYLSDILFSKEGFGLRPAETVSDGSPSLNATHLSNFATHPFVIKYLEYQKVQKMISTYVGLESALVYTPVKLLKNGGWPAKVKVMEIGREPEQMQTFAKLETVKVVNQDPDDDACLFEVDRLTEWTNDKALGRVGTDFVMLQKSSPTGFWKHLMPSGKIHPSFLLDRTVTGRSASRDPNFQNLPKRGELAKPFRRIFIPTKGNVFIECDLSQAELRFAACESLDPVMLATYRAGGDIHRLTAARVAGIPLHEVSKDLRQKAKAVNFGFLYTMGPDTFVIYARTQYGVEFTKKEAEEIRALYFRTYANLPKWHVRRREEVRRDGFVRALHGAKRNIPSINSTDRGVQAEAERQAINSPIQRIASDVTLLAMIQFTEGCPSWVLPNGTIHDSGIAESPEAKAMRVASWMKWCFINPPLEKLFGLRLPIPLGADIAIGKDLGSMEEVEVEPVKPPWIK